MADGSSGSEGSFHGFEGENDDLRPFNDYDSDGNGAGSGQSYLLISKVSSVHTIDLKDFEPVESSDDDRVAIDAPWVEENLHWNADTFKEATGPTRPSYTPLSP